MESSLSKAVLADRSHGIFRITVVVCVVLLAMIVFAGDEGNIDLVFPRLREALSALVESTRVGFVLFYFTEALRVLGPLYWLISGVQVIKQKQSLGPLVEDIPFVVAAILLPYGLFGYAMTDSDATRVRIYSLAWLVTASLWAIQTLVRNATSHLKSR